MSFFFTYIAFNCHNEDCFRNTYVRIEFDNIFSFVQLKFSHHPGGFLSVTKNVLEKNFGT